MVPLERKHFEKHGTLPAMDCLATLIFVTGSMWQMRATFRRVGHQGDDEAAQQILNACRKVAAKLVNASTRRDPQGELQKVRQECLPRLREAAEHSLLLAKTEQAETGAAGLFTKDVHARLLALVALWEASGQEAEMPGSGTRG